MKPLSQEFTDLGIEFVQGNENASDAGVMTLPKSFDQTKYAAKWAMQGSHVDAAENREYIPGTGMSFPGWIPWKNPEGGKIYTVPLSKGKTVLLCRLRRVQDIVNAAYGNLGRRHALAEAKGETISGAANQDPGMLPDSALTQFGERDPETAEIERTNTFRQVPLPVSGGEGESATVLQT